VLISPSKKPSLAHSSTVGQSRASPNLTDRLALSKPAQFGGTSLCRPQPDFQRAVVDAAQFRSISMTPPYRQGKSTKRVAPS